jgi:hypothetical protein
MELLLVSQQHTYLEEARLYRFEYSIVQVSYSSAESCSIRDNVESLWFLNEL